MKVIISNSDACFKVVGVCLFVCLFFPAMACINCLFPPKNWRQMKIHSPFYNEKIFWENSERNESFVDYWFNCKKVSRSLTFRVTFCQRLKFIKSCFLGRVSIQWHICYRKLISKTIFCLQPKVIWEVQKRGLISY